MCVCVALFAGEATKLPLFCPEGTDECNPSMDGIIHPATIVWDGDDGDADDDGDACFRCARRWSCAYNMYPKCVCSA